MAHTLGHPPPHQGTPLCHGCLQPVSPLEHYCPHCSRCVGQHTPSIPFVNIPYQMEFWGGLWNKIWTKEPVPFYVRVIGVFFVLLLLIAYAPLLLLLGLPCSVWLGYSKREKQVIVPSNEPAVPPLGTEPSNEDDDPIPPQ